MKKYLLIALILISFSSFSQENKMLNSMDFNGYMQLRGESNFNDNSSFSLRRLKLWIKSKPEFSEHWSYKIQTTVTSLQQEKFFLQDVKLTYKTAEFSCDLGQFVPNYSLQRFQSDYKLPVIERAKVINSLIPNGTIGVRDIGMQANYETKNKLLKTSIGFFNGYGIKEYRFSNKGYLLTHKTSMSIPLNFSKIQFGYSLQYRNADSLKVSKVLPDSVVFSGIDFRYNIFALFKSKIFEFQVEYLNADFEGKQANGYYILSAINIKKSQIMLSYEKYKDLILTTKDEAYFHLGYNYLINKHKLKLYLDYSFQIVDNKLNNNIATIQLQVFFK